MMRLVLFAFVTTVCFGLPTAWSDSLDDQEAEGKTVNGNYTFPNPNPCFILTAKITYNVTLPGETETRNGTIFDDHGITAVYGKCGQKTLNSSITIVNENISQPVTVEFEFMKNKTTNAWHNSKASITFPGTTMDDFGDYVFTGDGMDLSASGDFGLQCSQVNVSLNTSNANDRIVLYNVKLMPGFVSTDKPLETCSFDKSPKTSNVVPIAVGCALAGLVLIVLVAYLIGRTRHGRSTKGYQSV